MDSNYLDKFAPDYYQGALFINTIICGGTNMSGGRIMISACGSGSGKTTLVMALLAAFIKRNIIVQSFKCGPDYIDPMYHSKITGRPTYHTDPFFLKPEQLLGFLAEKSESSDLSVIEGAMGFYDGLGTSSDCSAYSVANITNTPVLLVINPKGMGNSVGAVCSGFLNYRKNNNISGVILNGIKPSMYEYYKKIISDNTNLNVYGFLPKLEEVHLESRHLGLITADEIKDFFKLVDILGDAVLQNIDLDGIIKLAKTAPPLYYNKSEIQKKKTVTLGVAKDSAFCFYYDENIELLEKFGAKIVNFSPLRDKKLPDGIDGIYIGGGYPELFARQLSENKSFINSINEAVKSGMPVFAECGGFMYLQNTMDGTDGDKYEMAGILSGSSHMEKKLIRFGYVKLTAMRDTLLLKKGESILGHEFHYADTTDNGNAVCAEKPNGITWMAVQQKNSVMAGFPHMYFLSNPGAAERFIKNMKKFQKRRLHNK